MLYEDIVKNRNAARLHGTKQQQSIYTVIVGEIQRAVSPTIENGVKKYDDDSVIKVLKNMIKNADISLQINPEDEEWIETKSILNKFVPAQLTEQALAAIKKSFDFANLGMFMKHLKEFYPNLYDGKVAKDVFERN